MSGRLNQIAAGEGLKWGGNRKTFTDKPHFENTFDKSVKQLLRLYNEGAVQNGFIKIK